MINAALSNRQQPRLKSINETTHVQKVLVKLIDDGHTKYENDEIKDAEKGNGQIIAVDKNKMDGKKDEQLINNLQFCLIRV